jgi:hypothetical protein
MDLAQPYSIQLQDVDVSRPSWIFEYPSKTTVDADTISRFDGSNPLTIPAAPQPGLNNPRYYKNYVVAPILTNG